VTHTLKCWPEYFAAVKNGTKTFEIRRDDRGFKVGDILVLQEWESPADGRASKYLGTKVRVEVTYITHFPDGLRPGYVAMGIHKLL